FAGLRRGARACRQAIVPRVRRSTHLAVVAAGLGVAVCAAGPTPGFGRDYAGQAFDVLPPGEAGGLTVTSHSVDQIGLYNGLTPQTTVRPRDLRRFFKRETLGLGGQRATRVEHPRRGLVIARDRWGV